MNRRELLHCLACLPAATVTTRLLAAPASGVKFLLVFLRGGVDMTNVLVPVSSEFYYRARPNIAIARPGPDAGSAIALDANWGLHPSLSETVLPMYQDRQAAFVAFAGTDDLSRSHFETQDSIELGQAPGGVRDFSSGFLNRLASRITGVRPIAFTDQVPASLRGGLRVANVSLRAIGKPAVDARQSELISGMYAHTRLAGAVSEGFEVRDEVMHDLGDRMDPSRGAVTAKGFEGEARRIATLMADRFDLGFVDVGGWDTHVGEGGANGYLAGRLGELGRALAAFAAGMGERWRDTVVVVISEFGRTFRENGNRGTDHGHGTVYWVLGGPVRGGRIAGEQQRLEEGTLFQDRDCPVLNEYRAVLGGVFARLYGLGSTDLDQVFPGAVARDLQLV